MKTQSETTITTWIAQWMVKELGLGADAIDTSKSFLAYSTDSVTAMTLVGDLEDWLGLRLSPTLAWDYPTIGLLAQYLAQQLEATPATNGKVETTALDTEQLLAQLDSLSEGEMDSLLKELLATGEAVR